MEKKGVTYRDAGVDIDTADSAKREMAKVITVDQDNRVLNRPGAFASLFAASFPGISDPVMVLKAEEPGTKPLLSFRFGKVREVCFDLINHLVNDIAVMGATPLAVLDTIICGKMEKKMTVELVTGMAEACRAHGCTLVGGETSEQPRVLDAGRYILSATVVGIVDRSKIIDGSAIRNDDVVLALASNGPHTNGYTLIRSLIEADEQLLTRQVDGRTFIDAVLEPHRAYFPFLRNIFGKHPIHGLAHITGGGVQDNLNRILPAGLSAMVDLNAIRIPAVFKMIRDAGKVPDNDMMRTFNMGVGMTLVTPASAAGALTLELSNLGLDAYPIGKIIQGTQDVRFQGSLSW